MTREDKLIVTGMFALLFLVATSLLIIVGSIDRRVAVLESRQPAPVLTPAPDQR